MESALYLDLYAQHRAIKGEALRTEVFHLIGNATDNAGDTCHEKRLCAGSEAHCAEWAYMFKATLESLLTDRSVSAAAVRWFAKRNIKG